VLKSFKHFFQQPQKLFSFYVPKEVMILGNVNTSLPCIIDGELEGNVISQKAITVGISGNILGNLTAENIVVYGKVIGTVLAKEKLFVYENGFIEGEAKAKETFIKESGIIQPPTENIQISKKEVFEEKVERIFVQPSLKKTDKTWF